MDIRVSGIIRESIVDGPGIRFVVFCQGCPHACEGCHNPQTHPFDGGNVVTTDRIMQEIEKNPLLKGVTFSGGEPFCQPEAFADLADKIHAKGLDVLAYSGFTFEELMNLRATDANVAEMMKRVDVLIDGRFELELKTLSLPYVGSSNQRILDLQKSISEGKAVEIKF